MYSLRCIVYKIILAIPPKHCNPVRPQNEVLSLCSRVETMNTMNATATTGNKANESTDTVLRSRLAHNGQQGKRKYRHRFAVAPCTQGNDKHKSRRGRFNHWSPTRTQADTGGRSETKHQQRMTMKTKTTMITTTLRQMKMLLVLKMIRRWLMIQNHHRHR